MTKYILNSGGTRNKPDKAAAFNIEIVKGLGQQPKVLFCLFAQPRENWERKFVEYRGRFQESLSDGVKPIFELAMPDNFIVQVKNCDAIIIHGGDDYLLQYWLKQYDLPSLWAGKVVAASSAGSNALARYYWTCDWRQCYDGLDILPIKFIPHYLSDFGADEPRGPIDWQKAHATLAEYKDKSLPIYALEEGDFIVLEK